MRSGPSPFPSPAVGGRRYDPPHHSEVLGGTMRHTTIALLATAVLALAGCSSSGSSPKPTPTVTVTKAPKVSAAAQRQACVDAWADAIDAGASADDTPKACKGLTDSAQLDAYMAGLSERNRRAQASFNACTDDPSCTEAP